MQRTPLSATAHTVRAPIQVKSCEDIRRYLLIKQRFKHTIEHGEFFKNKFLLVLGLIKSLKMCLM